LLPLPLAFERLRVCILIQIRQKVVRYGHQLPLFLFLFLTFAFVLCSFSSALRKLPPLFIPPPLGNS
jgi:hypothetical protein